MQRIAIAATAALVLVLVVLLVRPSPCARHRIGRRLPRAGRHAQAHQLVPSRPIVLLALLAAIGKRVAPGAHGKTAAPPRSPRGLRAAATATNGLLEFV